MESAKKDGICHKWPCIIHLAQVSPIPYRSLTRKNLSRTFVESPTINEGCQKQETVRGTLRDNPLEEEQVAHEGEEEAAKGNILGLRYVVVVDGGFLFSLLSGRKIENERKIPV